MAFRHSLCHSSSSSISRLLQFRALLPKGTGTGLYRVVMNPADIILTNSYHNSSGIRDRSHNALKPKITHSKHVDRQRSRVKSANGEWKGPGRLRLCGRTICGAHVVVAGQDATPPPGYKPGYACKSCVGFMACMQSFVPSSTEFCVLALFSLNSQL